MPLIVSMAASSQVACRGAFCRSPPRRPLDKFLRLLTRVAGSCAVGNYTFMCTDGAAPGAHKGAHSATLWQATCSRVGVVTIAADSAKTAAYRERYEALCSAALAPSDALDFLLAEAGSPSRAARDRHHALR